MGSATERTPGAGRATLRVGATAVLTLALLGGCKTRPEHPAASYAASAGPVRPTLEEVFLQPPIHGEPPLIEATSPDGRFVLVRWNEAPKEKGEEPDAHLVDLDDPDGSGSWGRKVADLLPPVAGEGEGSAAEADPEPPELGPLVWSHFGHALAVARGTNVYVVDPATRACTPFLLGEPEPDDAGDAEESETPARRFVVGAIKSLAFAPDDASLRFADEEELYSLPFPNPGAPSSLDEATWWSEAVEPPALKVRWSLDLGVVFGEDPTPLERNGEDGAEEDDEPAGGPEEQEGGQEGEQAPAPADETVSQVYHLQEGRAVTLQGMADEEWMERMAISPDGRFVVGAAYDRSGEPEKNLVPDYLTDRVTTKTTRNQRADDLPSPFELWMWDTATGERRPVLPDGPRTTLPEPADAEEGSTAEDETANEGAPFHLRTLGWAPQPEPGAPARFVFELYSQDHRELTVWCWTEGFCVKVFEEHDPAWVGGPARNTKWTEDGRFLLVGSEARTDSTTPGRTQVFLVDPDGGDVRQLSEVEGEVTRFQPLADGGFLLEASRSDLARRAVGLVPAEILREPPGSRTPPGDCVRWFPAPEGFNSAAAGSRDGRRIAFRHERLFSPNEVWTTDGEHTRRVTRTWPEAFGEPAWILPERLTLRAPDGRLVRAHVFLPPGTSLDPPRRARRPRAAIVFVHGAGYLQNVTDSMTRYPLNLMFHSRLAHLGYPVIDVDYRGSAGYGRDFRTDVQYHLGGKDLDDIHLVVDELVARGLVDHERVGIYGGSYGGFMTMMALFTAPERWAAGAALRSVTDWRTYNPWYTQVRLGRPSTHPEAYERSSPIDHAETLEDPLLVLHGLMDKNVFAQDSIRLIEKLIDLGKDFDAMLYPSQGHAFEDGPHWLDEYERIERHLLEHLGPPLEDESP